MWRSSDTLIVPLRVIFLFALLEFSIFIFSGVNLSSLSGDHYFDLNVDPLRWIFYLLRLPQLVLSYSWLAIAVDVAILTLFIALLVRPHNHWLALSLLILLMFYYATLTGYLTHRNYQTGFFLLLFPFVFSRNSSKLHAFQALRYFLLFFYLSAALLKDSSGAMTDPHHFSRVLQLQFLPYYLESNTGWRTGLNQYLVSHIKLAYVLYVGAFLLELSALAGFLTRRFDRLLALFFVIFHLLNWCLMDIAPFGQLSLLCLLFFSNEMIAGLKGLPLSRSAS